MSQPDIIITLLKYFAKFIPKEVLEEMFVKGDSDEHPGYAELQAEIMNLPDTDIIEDIDCFVFSTNEEYVANQMRGSDKIVFFVEYGAFSYDPTEKKGVKEKLAIQVAFPYSMTNSDNIVESMLMNRMHNILCSVLDKMEEDQSDLNFCSNKKLIRFPAEIVPIDPHFLYGRAGWMALFDHETTNLI